MIPVGIDLVGAAMHARFAAEGKPGVTMRSGSSYSTWWNGGLRTTAYFHNQIGLLTETIGRSDADRDPVRARPPAADAPICRFRSRHRRWHFRQSVEYSMTANRAVLDVASRFRETLLYNAYRMGRNSIDRGNRDTWTVSPATPALRLPSRVNAAANAPTRTAADPRFRDPRGYILPSDQPDFLTATKFVDALLKAGVTVHRATTTFRGRRHGRIRPGRSS